MVLDLAVQFMLINITGVWTFTALLHVALNSVILYPSINKIFLFHNRMYFDRSDNDKTKYILVRVMAL